MELLRIYTLKREKVRKLLCEFFLLFFFSFLLLYFFLFFFLTAAEEYTWRFHSKLILSISSGHGWMSGLKNNALGTRISIGGFLFIQLSSFDVYLIEVGVDGVPIVLDVDYLLCFGSSVLLHVVLGLSESSRLLWGSKSSSQLCLSFLAFAYPFVGGRCPG